MTNGEMIQKVFNCEVCEPIIEDDIIHVIFADKKDSAIGLDWSWWNAEYKEPKTGHWEKTPKAVMGEGYMWYCDKCGHEVYQDSSRDYPSENFCPHCGADMRGEIDGNRN